MTVFKIFQGQPKRFLKILGFKVHCYSFIGNRLKFLYFIVFAFTTSIAFAAPFTYTNNSGLTSIDDNSKGVDKCVNAIEAPASINITSRVNQSSDDAEENGGTMDLSSGDLEMVENGGLQTVGMRFKDLTIPNGSIIISAHIDFYAEQSDGSTTDLVIHGEDTDNSVTFTSTSNNITDRTTTSSTVNWASVPSWTVNNTYYSPDISNIIQEIVDRVGWVSGNHLAIIVDGSVGRRSSMSYDQSSSNAPLLNVTYAAPLEICGNAIDDNGDGRTDEPYPGMVQENMLLWLKADVGFTGATWEDQSIEGNDATVFGDPTQVTNSMNYNPGINFDGDDHVEVNLPELVFDSGTHHAVIFAVYKPSTSSSAIGILGNQGTSNGTIELYNNFFGIGYGSLIMSSAYGLSPHLITYTIDEEDNVGGAANSSPFYHNGDLKNSVTYNEGNSAQVTSNFHIGKSGSWGSSLYFQGDIQEVIIYYEDDGNPSISDSERQKIETYLATKYGISLSHDYTDSQ